MRTVPEKIWEEDPVFQKSYVTLKLRLSSKMAYRVYDEFDTYEVLPDGGFMVELQYPKEEWLYQYLGSYGDQCEVLEPKSVRDEVQKRLKRTLQIYEI